MEWVEVVQFTDSCNFILDAAGKSVVKLSVEGSITPIDFGGELLKADNVFSNFLVIIHFEPFKLILSISINVKWAEVGWEFQDKFSIIIGSSRIAVWVHEKWFEVVECCPLEEGEHVVDLVHVEMKHIVSVAEVELQLNLEGLKLLRVRAIKWIGFMDFGVLGCSWMWRLD